MTSLKVLITNHAMINRAGTEMYVYELALALQKMGHRPFVYTPENGSLGYKLHQASVPVIDNLENISFVPDIIHGHHHLPCLTALLHFVDVPAIYFCHGWAPEQEAVLKHPRIMRYFAFSDVCYDRLIKEGVPETQVETLLNFVNLDRFLPRPPLPIKPKRALLYSNSATKDFMVPTIMEACLQQGIDLDVIGMGVNNPSNTPELLLPQYDIIFAVGKSALESLAVGASVILCDYGRIGPMVTSANFQKLRKINFCLRSLIEPLTKEAILREINSYDSQDTALVLKTARQSLCKNQVIDQLVSFYQVVIDEYKVSKAKMNLDDELRAVSRYLQLLSPPLKFSLLVELTEEVRHHTNQIDQLMRHHTNQIDQLMRHHTNQIDQLISKVDALLQKKSLARLVLSKIYHCLRLCFRFNY